jgi:hypothetical protein
VIGKNMTIKIDVYNAGDRYVTVAPRKSRKSRARARVREPDPDATSRVMRSWKRVFFGSRGLMSISPKNF